MHLTVKGFLWRGLAAGAVGGLASAIFLAVVTETQIGRALDFEKAAELGGAAHDQDHLVGRSAQVIGGMTAAVLLGALVGLVLAGVVALLHDRVRSHDESGRVLKVAAAAFVATSLLPTLKYPANPPTVGDADTVGQRTGAYLALIITCVLIVVAAREIWHRLEERGQPLGARFLLGGAAFTVMVAAAFIAFPANADRVEPPRNEAAPALVVAPDAPGPVLDAMADRARGTGGGALRDLADPSEPLAGSAIPEGQDLVGTPVAVSTAELVPHSYATLVWAFRLRSLAGIALLWAVTAGVLGLLLDRAGRSTDPLH